MVKGPSLSNEPVYLAHEVKPDLRPYPIDPKQEKVVKRVSRLAAGILAVQGAVSSVIAALFFPIHCIITFISRLAKSKKVEPPTTAVPLSFDGTQKIAMDSKFYYTVSNGKVLFKPIAATTEAPWKEFGNEEGFADTKHTPLIAVSADGDNVVAVDENNHIHYAKSDSVDVRVSFDAPDWEVTAGSRVSWTNKWFNMDLVAPIYNLFKDPKLTLKENIRSFGISHKGSDTLYYTDMAGKKHPDPLIGVTTLYVLNEDGTRYFLADPWLHNKFDNELTGPEDGQFVAESMAVSASSLFVIQRARDENGKEIHKMYTRYADFDSIGSNPALPATYDIDNATALVRYLPAEDWLQQPVIPLEGQARLTKEIFVLQTGRGQDHRQLRVVGTDKDGSTGYYYKNIYDQEWSFEKTGQNIPEGYFLSTTVPHTGFEKGPPIVRDYAGSVESKLKNAPEVVLRKFATRGLNERGLHTKVECTCANGQKLEIPLYARRGFRHLLGFDGSSKKLYWTLVIPKEYRQSQDPQVKELLKGLFNNKKTVKVHVEEASSGITITPEFFSGNKFKMHFKSSESVKT